MRELSEGSIILGMLPGTDFEDHTADGLAVGSVLFIGTDGIWEARNPVDEMFGKDRMIEALRSSLDGTSRDIGMAVEAALEKFLSGRKIQDDVTYVVLKLMP